MRHRQEYGCVLIHVNLHGLACKNHDTWIGVDGLPYPGRFNKRPSEVSNENRSTGIQKERKKI